MLTKISKIAFILLLFSSCGSEQKEEAAIGETLPAKLTLVAWSEYFDPEVLDQFKQETGIEIEYVSYDDTDELEARLKSEPGAYDVVVADSTSIDRLGELRLIQKLKPKSIPNLKNIDEQYLDRLFDPKNAYSVPYAWGTTLIAFRKDKIADPVESWEILWDAKYKGRVMVLGDRTEALGIGLISQGLPMNSAERSHLDSAADWLIRQMENVDLRFGSDSDVRDLIGNGSIWVATCYSGDAAMVAAENDNVGFFIPEQGAPLWMDNFAVAADTNHSTHAAKLINFMLRADVAAANANFTWYASPNKAAIDMINPELAKDESINPPQEVRDRCFFFEKPTAGREELMNECWLRVRSAMRKKHIAQGSVSPLGETETALTEIPEG